MDILSSFPNPGSLLKSEDLNWGVLGTARIAQNSVIPAIKAVRHNAVAAVASRDLTRAMEFAKALEITRAYGSYDELLADPEIGAVYIPLPNREHAKWAIKAMEAGKHVLVEKPIALTADEAQLMVSSALEHSVVLMENFKNRYGSRFSKALDIVRKGEIGKPRFLDSSFTFQLTNPDDIRLTPDLGGGALYDVGCYSIDLQRLLVGREPKSVWAVCRQGNTGVDLQLTAVLDFGDHVYGHFDAAFDAYSQQHARVVGTDGVLEIGMPFKSDGDSFHLLTKAGETKKISFKAENDYRQTIEHFYYVVTSREAPLFPLADSVKNMIVIEALFQSVIDGGRVVQIA